MHDANSNIHNDSSAPWATITMLRVWCMMMVVSSDTPSEHNRRWAASMEGYEGAADDVTVAHQNSVATIAIATPAGTDALATLRQREEQLDRILATGATHANGAGPR